MAYLSLNIKYDASKVCEEVSFEEAGEHDYTLGSTIIVSDSRLSRSRSIIVMGVEKISDSESGVTTQVNGFTEEYIYTRKAPLVTLTFVTMTREELSAFWEENDDRQLDYCMKTAYGDEYGCKGWTAHDIITQIVTEYMGLELVNNLPNFDVSSFSVDTGSTYFDSIMSLISEFNPIITLVGDTLYLLERGGVGILSAGQWPIPDKTNVSVIKEHVAEPACIRVEGEDGAYNGCEDPCGWLSWVLSVENGIVTSMTKDINKYEGSYEYDDGTKEDYEVTNEYNIDWCRRRYCLYRQTNERAFTPSVDIDPDRVLRKIKTVTTYTYYDGKAGGYDLFFGTQGRYPDTFDTKYETPVIYSYTIESFVWVPWEGSTIFGDWLLVQTQYIKTQYGEDWLLEGELTVVDALFVDTMKSVEQVDTTVDSVLFDFGIYDVNEMLVDEYLVYRRYQTTKRDITPINEKSYGESTITITDSFENNEWVSKYDFQHQIVDAGGQQEGSPTLNTMQVFAGDCPNTCEFYTPEGLTVDEPPLVINIPTPNWDDIVNCYNYLVVLYAKKMQTATISAPAVDPLPYISLSSLGSMAEDNIPGNYYVTGYNVIIDADRGYYTTLESEAIRGDL